MTVFRRPIKDYISSVEKDIRKGVFLQNTFKDLDETVINYNVNARDQSDIDRQSSTKYIFYGKLDQILPDINILDTLSLDSLKIINNTSKEINWDFKISYPKEKIDYNYNFFGFNFKSSDGIPYSSVTINNINYVYSGVKHNLEETDFILINGTVFSINFIGDDTNSFDNKDYIFTVNGTIPKIGTFKKVKNPFDIENSTSEYTVLGLAEFDNTPNINYISFSNNYFKNPNFSVIFPDIVNIEQYDLFGLPLMSVYLTIDKKPETLMNLSYDWVSGQDYNGDGRYECGFHTIETYNFSIGEQVKIQSISGANYTTIDFNEITALGSDNIDSNDPLLNNMFTYRLGANTYTPLQTDSNGKTQQSSGIVTIKNEFDINYGYKWDMFRQNKQKSLFRDNKYTGTTALGPFVEYNPYEVKTTILSDLYERIILKKNNLPDSKGVIHKVTYEIPIKYFSKEIETGDKLKDIIPDYSVYSPFENIWKWRDILSYGIFEDNLGLDFPYNNNIHYVFFNKTLYLSKEYSDVETQLNKDKIYNFSNKC